MHSSKLKKAKVTINVRKMTLKILSDKRRDEIELIGLIYFTKRKQMQIFPPGIFFNLQHICLLG